MDSSGQLKLLVWKDILVRRRHVGVASLIFGWAIAVFLILYIVRESVDPEYTPTCQYKARALPSTGLFPFIQSFVCNVDNKCGNLSQYEEVPRYRDARVTSIAEPLQSAFSNESILGVVKSLPDFIRVFKSVGQSLDTPDMEGIFGRGVPVAKMFDDTGSVKRQLKRETPMLDPNIVDEIFNASLKFGPVFKALTSNDMGSTVCEPAELEKYLILNETYNIDEVAEALCNISEKSVPSLLHNVITHADFTELLAMLGKVSDSFTTYDVYEDISNILDVFLNLKFVQRMLPPSMKLSLWLPKVIPLMKTMNRTYLDPDFVQQSLDVIEPYFNETQEWPSIKTAVLQILESAIKFQDVIVTNIINKHRVTPVPSKDFSELITHIEDNLSTLNKTSYLHSPAQKMLLEIADAGLHLAQQLYLNTTGTWLKIANTLDSLTHFLGRIMREELELFVFLYKEGVLAFHNLLRNNFESEDIIYDITEKHSDVVSTLLSLGPDFIKSMFNCFKNITCTTVLIQNRDNISNIFCNEEKRKLFPNSVKDLDSLCAVNFNSMVKDIIDNFNFDRINRTILESDKRIYQEQEYDKNEGNFSQAVIATDNLVQYIFNKSRNTKKRSVSWDHIIPSIENPEWQTIVNEANKNKGLYLLNIQLCYFKEIMVNNTSLDTPLNATAQLMRGFNWQYRLVQTPFIKSLISHLPAVMTSIVNTFTNKTQILAMTAIDDWNTFFCNSTALDDNVQAVAKLICQKMNFLKMHSQIPWYYQPLISTINTVATKYRSFRYLDWNYFITTAQDFYLNIEDIINLDIPVIKWHEMEIFQPAYWMNWLRHLNVEEEIHFGVKILMKILEFIERNYFDPDTQAKFHKIEAISSSVNHVAVFVNDIIDFAIVANTRKSYRLGNYYPKTYALATTVIQGLDNITRDFENLLSENADVSDLVEWFKHPCSRNITDVVPKFSNQSKTSLKALQQAVCGIETYEEEWNFRTEPSEQSLHKSGQDWQLAVDKFGKLSRDIRNRNKNYHEDDIGYINDEALRHMANGDNVTRLLFEIVDKELETNVLRQETLSELYRQLMKCERQSHNVNCTQIRIDTARYTSRFIATGLSEIAETIRKYIHTIHDAKGVDPIILLGFSNTTAIYNLYLKLPDYIKMFVHSYRSPEFEMKIVDRKTRGLPIGCQDIMSYLTIPENNSVTLADIQAAKRYFCPSFLDWPIMQDNIFLAAITKLQDMYLDTPVSKFRTSYVNLLDNLLELVRDTGKVLSNGRVHVKHLWNKIWADQMKKTFLELKELNFTSDNTITRFFKYIDVQQNFFSTSNNLIDSKFGFGDFAFVLNYTTDALQKFVSLNFTSEDLSTEEDIKIVKELHEYYPKQLAGILTYAYFRINDSYAWSSLQTYCTSDLQKQQLGLFIPTWMRDDEEKIMERLCKVDLETVTADTFSEAALSSVKNYNVNVEESILNFISGLISFENHNFTVSLSSVLLNSLDLKHILNGTYPTDEALRNASMEKATDLVDIQYDRALRELDETLQFNTVLLKILQGGDWWKYLLSVVKQPVLLTWLHIFERLPHIVLHLTDAALSHHFIYDITRQALRGQFRYICDPTVKLEDYVHEDNIISVIRRSCQTRHKELEIFDIEINGTEVVRTRNVNKLAEHILEFERNLIDLLRTGPKKFELPDWLNETMILQEYKNFAKKNSEPLTLLQTVTKLMHETIDVGSIVYKKSENNCAWCTWATELVKEFNRHLAFSQNYVDLLCHMPQMNFTEIRTTLMNDFKWGLFYKDMTNKNYSVEDFDREMHHVVDVVRDQLIRFYSNKTLRALPQECLKNIGKSQALRNVTTYVTAASEIIRFVRSSSIHFLNTSSINVSQNILHWIKEDIPIWKTQFPVLKKALFDDYDFYRYSGKINVNELIKLKGPKDAEKYFTDEFFQSKLFDRVFYLRNGSATLMSIKLYNNINRTALEENIGIWRNESVSTFSWLFDILDNLDHVISSGGDILEFMSTIDFNGLTAGKFNISNMLSGILDVLHRNSIEKLFSSLHELIHSLSPIIRSQVITKDLETLLNAVENMTIFQNIGYLRTKYNISNLVADWTNVREYLIEEINLDENIVDQILNASIDLFTIISSQKDLLNAKDVCGPELFQKYFRFASDDPVAVSNQVAKTFCSMQMNDIQKIAIALFKNMNFSSLLNNVMHSSIGNILTSANMTEEEGKIVMKNIGVGVELLPFFKNVISNISREFNDMPRFEGLTSDSSGKAQVVSSSLLAAGGRMLCGRPLVQKSNKLYKTISEAKDFNAKKFDTSERESLPTKFCRDLYEDIVQMDAGKVVWSYIKPLIRGKILFTPIVPAVREIVSQANTTFASIAQLEEILFKIIDTLAALDNPKEIKHILENIQGLLNSSIVRSMLQEALGAATQSSKISLSQLNLTDMFDNLGDSKRMSSALKFGGDILKCILLDRFVGVDSEHELEQVAKELMRRNEFIAGIVFLNMDHRSKRSTDIPLNISYKIRMDIDSVPSTNYLKYKFWTPGPDGDFLDDLRYFRGFIQLQDLIDNAIIKLKSPKELPTVDVLTQQMPYPCWTHDLYDFKSALSISQTFQVCFFFALIVIVASAVRYVVWEKESGNTMIMNVMGLRYQIHCASWFIVTLIEILIIMVSIFIILKAGGILPMTSGSLFFLYLLDFGFSVIMFCYMVSSFFDSASLAAVGSAIFYLLTFMPYIIIISLETTMSTWLKILTNLSMSTSFCYGCLYVMRYELQGVGLQWHNAWDTPIPGDSMSFGMTCVFLLLDGILYGIVGYLCSRKTIGLQKIFHYLPSWLFTNNYQVISDTDSYVTFDNELFLGANTSGNNYLDDTLSCSNIVNDEPLKIGVTIKGLTKIYNSRKKAVKAIENIDIGLYIGQVTTLLGHNGAGKTTLIKILTGMMPPSAGQIIINSEITENYYKTSRYLGVCPQGSVLIDTMSAVEHLIFYAKLKTARTTAEVMPEVMVMIDNLGLGFLSNEPVANLSEGMRRRLCVAIAFIGKPKLVVLDEPSTGVDPVARRQIWDLIVRYKAGCTVLLTTHYLDEAELLSDRVIVLHKGKVLCSGSPLVLKQAYGKGYRVKVTFPSTKEEYEVDSNKVNTLLTAIQKTAPNANLTETKGAEVSIMVPFNSPAAVPNNFEEVAYILEEKQPELGFSTFAMNCTTLEEVFMDLCDNEDAKLGDTPVKSDTVSQIGHSYSNIFANSVDDLSATKDEEVLINTRDKLTGTNKNKFCALLKKRAIHYLFDWRVIICALVLPTLFTAVAMGFSLIRPPNANEPALKLTPELYTPHTTAFISVDTDQSGSFANRTSKEIVSLASFKNYDLYPHETRQCECRDGMQTCSKSSQTFYDTLLKLSSPKEIVDWVVETQDEYIERRYGGWSLTDQPDNRTTLTVWYNNKGYHAMPSYLNTMNSAILRTVSPGSVINTYSHPLKLSVDQLSKSSIAQHIADVGIAMVLLLAFSLVPASGAIYLVQERVNEEKRLQYLCGVSPTLYWLVAFIWDMIMLICSLILAIVVFKIFGLPVYVARENLAAVSLLIFLYGWACIPLIHLLQRWFNDASMANMILFCGCAFVGISELTCILLMDILGKTQFVADFRQILHKIYLLFPQFVLGDGLVEISKNNIQSEILQRFHMDTYVSPLSWDLMGLHYLSLALIGVILFLANLIIENQWFKSMKNKSSVYPSESWCVETVNLTKEFKTISGIHKAVNELSLRVPFGQCLGLIGVNGAGKSTTFKMLTTELRPTCGKIFLQGREINQKPLYTGEMGYCSQCDSLDPKLTVQQTVVTYLTLRGTETPYEDACKILHKFELSGYANRKTEHLSGGNKRKLCAALSVLGKTSLILMDEPTSGMDPYSRHLVATTIQQLIRRNRSVILTSHSVEDCEALCSQVAVMINGKVICQGSPQELKERYGSGYIISIRLLKPSDQDELQKIMQQEFPGSELMSRQYCSSQFSVPTEHTRVSEMFSRMSKIAAYTSIEDFNLVQSSLDQVFINLANKSNELLSSNTEDLKSTLPNMYSMEIL